MNHTNKKIIPGERWLDTAELSIAGVLQVRLLAWNPDTIGECHAIWADARFFPK
jgi:hypothetical protein